MTGDLFGAKSSADIKAQRTKDLHALMDAIEALRDDRKAALTVLMSAAVNAMYAVVDDETWDRLPRPAGFRILVTGEHRIDLVAGDRSQLLAEVPEEMIQERLRPS